MDWNGDMDCRPMAIRRYLELPAEIVDSLSHPANPQAIIQRHRALSLHSCRGEPDAMIFHLKPEVSVVSCEANRG